MGCWAGVGDTQLVREGEFLGGPEVTTQGFHCRGSIPRQGTKIPRAAWYSEKKRKKVNDQLAHEGRGVRHWRGKDILQGAETACAKHHRQKKKKKAQQAPQGQRVCRGACRRGGGEECWREVGQGLKRVLSRVLKRKREDVISRSLNAGLRRFPVVTET